MRILIIADTHLAQNAVAFQDNLNAIERFIRADSFDSVIHLGDITADAPFNSDQLVYAAQSLRALGLPVLSVPGNHDVGDNPMEPGALTSANSITPDRVSAYEAVFGPDHWALDMAGWQIVGLNAQLFGTGGAQEQAQFGWLEETLAASDKPLGLVSHKPFFRDGHDDTQAHIRYIPAEPRRRLTAMLSTRQLRFVLSGHAHQQRAIRVDGVDHIWLPSTAFCLPDAMQDKVGDKVVGLGVLELLPEGQFRFDRPEVEGLVRHNIVDCLDAYPSLAGMREMLGREADL